MEKRYLIDTNIFIYYFSNLINEKQTKFIKEIFKSDLTISTITKIELLGWKNISNEETEKIELFLNPAKIIYINNEIENQAIEIRKLKSIKLPDAVIAATAIVNDFTLISRNDKDFKNIDQLKYLNIID